MVGLVKDGVDDRSEGVGLRLQGASALTLDVVSPMADGPEELTELTLRVSS
jgi:hypothetical protein